MMQSVVKVLTPLFAFASLFLGLYCILFAASRIDWLVIGSLAIGVIGCAVAAFMLRKTRVYITFALVTAPALLLLAAVVLR